MNCKNCNKEHDGTFGSGKYCSRSCANRRQYSSEVYAKISESLKKTPIFKNCLECNKSFQVKQGTIFCSRSCSSRNHGKLENLSLETRAKLKLNAIKRHSLNDGNIGFRTRDKFHSSWPEIVAETFFTKHHIPYQREVRLGKWFADFLFANNIVVEIDGQQHKLPDRLAKDKIKDKYLQEVLKMKVIRIEFTGTNEAFFKSLEDAKDQILS